MSVESNGPERRVVGKPFPPGMSGNPGGKPKKLREIEAMLDEEHRTVPAMREVFRRLKALALGEVVHEVDGDGEVSISLCADARFMALYLNRVLGPVKDVPIDLSEVPEEELRVLREKLRQ